MALTESTREIVEGALGRTLTAEEEAGYPTLAELPAEVLASARQLRHASNLATVSVYLQHVVPSATLDQVKQFMDELLG